MFQEIMSEWHMNLSEYKPYADIAGGKAWDGLDPEWREKTLDLGESYLGYEYPALPATLYMEFCRTGNRRNYEKVGVSRRHALNALVLAECVERKGRFLDDIINGIFSICEESAWQLPAHNLYVRDGAHLILPDTSRPVLDLVACETAATLSVVYYLLKPVLDKVSPVITGRIRAELERRIFIPYLSRHFWWMGDGKDHMNNWTIWCTQNVLLSVLLTDQGEELKQKILRKACVSADYFLAEYGEDGCCEEGAQYYRHSGLCLFNTIEILNAVTEGAFLPLYESAKIKNMATYILRVHVQDKYYVNFADCAAIAGRSGVREFLFGKRTGEKELTAFAAWDFRAGREEAGEFLLLKEENSLFYRLQNGFSVSEIKEYPDMPETEKRDCHSGGVPSDIYYPSTGLLIVRDGRRVLAVKAGDNGDSHNHNDVGSFTVYQDGRPMFIDVGVETYTQKTFSPSRYEIWTMQSAYHNLPLIRGRMQQDGKEFGASRVEWYLEEKEGGISMDIAGAYPKGDGTSPGGAEIEFYRRRAVLEKEKRIVITDEFSAPAKEVILSLMTHERPNIVRRDPPLVEVGTLGSAVIRGGCVKEVEEIPVADERLKSVWGSRVYRILVQAQEQRVQIEMV